MMVAGDAVVGDGMTAGSWSTGLGFLPLKTREMSLRITDYRSKSCFALWAS